MKVGCLNSPLRRQPGASFISRGRWQLKKRKSSKQLCEKAKDGCSDRRVPPRSSESRGPRWNRRLSHSRLTRIASGLSREHEKNSRLIFGHDLSFVCTAARLNEPVSATAQK